MRHFISVLFGEVFTSAVCWSIGRVLFARLRIRLRTMEHDLLAGVTGAAILSTLIFLLCAIHLARIPAFWAIGLGAIALNWKYGVSHADGQPDPLHCSPKSSRMWKWVFGVPFAFYALLYLSNSLAPENSPDGQAYHLGIVYRYFRQHGFEPLTTNFYGNLSQGMEMLYLFLRSRSGVTLLPPLCIVAFYSHCR